MSPNVTGSSCTSMLCAVLFEYAAPAEQLLREMVLNAQLGGP